MNHQAFARPILAIGLLVLPGGLCAWCASFVRCTVTSSTTLYVLNFDFINFVLCFSVVGDVERAASHLPWKVGVKFFSGWFIFLHVGRKCLVGGLTFPELMRTPLCADGRWGTPTSTHAVSSQDGEFGHQTRAPHRRARPNRRVDAASSSWKEGGRVTKNALVSPSNIKTKQTKNDTQLQTCACKHCVIIIIIKLDPQNLIPSGSCM